MNFLKGYRTFVLAAVTVLTSLLGVDDGTKKWQDAIPQVIAAVGLVTAALHEPKKDESK